MIHMIPTTFWELPADIQAAYKERGNLSTTDSVDEVHIDATY